MKQNLYYVNRTRNLEKKYNMYLKLILMLYFNIYTVKILKTFSYSNITFIAF